MDLFGDSSKKEEVTVFIKLLWEGGTFFERGTINKLSIPFLDLSIYSGDEKEQRTKDAMDKKTPLIYVRRISTDDVFEDPDLLRFEEIGYVPVEIKSGSGEEGDATNTLEISVQ